MKLRGSRVSRKLKPSGGFSPYFHLGLTTLLPILVYVLVRIDFMQLALLLILLSKWRIFVVRPRYWVATFRANAVDIMVGVSLLVFMSSTDAASWQLFWAVVYEAWLIAIKPGSSPIMVSLQAYIAHFLALTALFVGWTDPPLFAIVIAVWLIAYLCARHFFTSFDERLSALFSNAWAYFSAALAWVLAHWLLFFYGFIAQPTLILSVIAFGLGGLYFLDQSERLTTLVKRYFVYTMTAIMVVIIVFSDWGDKAI
jgi:hypothetical protein